MTCPIGPAPSPAVFEAMARAALAALPDQFRAHLGGVLLIVEDFADEPTLAALGIDDPFGLTGLYTGVPLSERCSDQAGSGLADTIHLYRRPILDEWAARGDVTLERLVSHVLIHEVGHHFGLSDDDIHALEDAVD